MSTLMNNLNLPNPKMMDVAVPANMQVGLAQEEIARRGWAVQRRARRMALIGRPDVALVDLRERTEREKHGVIPGSLHAPYPDLQPMSAPAACCTSSPVRPASASCSIAPSASARRWRCRPRRTPASPRACHIQGGIDAWKKAERAAGALIFSPLPSLRLHQS